ncbi:hypothetical protein STIAU_3224 [Stigmatella aurantiaca DW4/3-1]|uniref:Uncharacterized protein n=1 Tax=Stigmatella aurantiaca (strain DW4/3-1) TaxID=378806 RepID=Q08TC0_STIAD|nr:hypothetical protein STIAU_3224 [Stigmatella aurantiaca DW4/3-1]
MEGPGAGVDEPQGAVRARDGQVPPSRRDGQGVQGRGGLGEHPVHGRRQGEDARGPVVSAHGEPLPVRGERDGVHRARVSVEDPAQASARLPHPGRAVIAARGEPLAIRGEGEPVDAPVMLPQQPALARGELPQAHLAVPVARRELLPVRREGHGPEDAELFAEHPALARAHVPLAQGLILSPRDGGVPERGEGQGPDRPPVLQRARGAPLQVPELCAGLPQGVDEDIPPVGRTLELAEGAHARREGPLQRAGGHVPEAQQVISPVAGEQVPSVGRERNAIHGARVAREHLALARVQLPQSRGAVLAGGGGEPLIRREHQPPHLIGMSREDPGLAPLQLPDADRVVVAARDEAPAIPGEGHVVQRLRVAAQHGGQAPRLRVRGQDAHRGPPGEVGREAAQPGDGLVWVLLHGGAGVEQGELVGSLQGQLPRVLRVAPGRLGLHLLALGTVPLGDDAPHAHRAHAGQQQQRHRRHRHGRPVAAHEAQGPLPERVHVRADNLPRLEAPQVLRQLARGGVALRGLARHRLGHQREQVLGDAALALAKWRGRVLHHLLEDLIRGAAIVGLRARQQVVEDGAQGVHIGALVHGVGGGLLRGHVGRGANDGAQPGEAPVLGSRLARLRESLGPGALSAQVLGQPPVDDHRLPEVSHQHVGRLEVPVDDALGVGVGDGLGHREHVRQQRQPLLQRLLLGEDVRQRAARDELHREEGLAAGPTPRFVDGDDGGVLEAGGDEGLGDEARLHVPAGRQQLLDGHGPVQALVPGPEDAADAPLRQLPDERVAARFHRGQRQDRHVHGSGRGASRQRGRRFQGRGLPSVGRRGPGRLGLIHERSLRHGGVGQLPRAVGLTAPACRRTSPTSSPSGIFQGVRGKEPLHAPPEVVAPGGVTVAPVVLPVLGAVPGLGEHGEDALVAVAQLLEDAAVHPHLEGGGGRHLGEREHVGVPFAGDGEGARLAEDVAEDFGGAQPEVQRHEAPQRSAQHPMDARLAALVHEVELLVGQGQHLVQEEGAGGLAAEVLHGAGGAAVGHAGERHGADAPRVDEVVHHRGEAPQLQVVQPVEHHHQRAGAGPGGLVEDHLARGADRELRGLHAVAGEAAPGDAARAVAQGGGGAAGHVEEVVAAADAVVDEEGVERVLEPPALGVLEGVLDIGVMGQGERPGPEAGGDPLQGQGLAAPVLEAARDEHALGAAPDKGGGLGVDDGGALGEGSFFQEVAVHGGGFRP